MKSKALSVGVVVVLLLVLVVPAYADRGKPSFSPAIYADGEAYGTKGTTSLPAPTPNNVQSFDGLFHFGNDAVEGQLAVAEAAPGNPLYNGGRWITYKVTWNVEPELVTSYGQLMALEEAGDVSIAPEGDYIQCPLLPVH